MRQKNLRILAVANQKGGVGKTTTTVNLATALAAIGKKVTLVDLDPQGNASTGLGVAKEDRGVGIYGVMAGQASVEEASRQTIIPGLKIIPSTMDLSGAEIELVNVENREFLMKGVFEDLESDQDYILIDCPPSLGLLTLNSLVAADGVIVPLQCEFYALEGLSHLIRTIRSVQSRFNPDLEIQGIVLTMFDRRNNLSGIVADDVREHMGDKVYNTVIPRNVKIPEASSYGKPVMVYDYKSTGAMSYIMLAKEMIKREGIIVTSTQVEGRA